MDKLTANVLSFLEQKRADFLKKWKEKAMPPPEPSSTHWEALEDKGKFIYQTVLHALTLSQEELPSYIQEAAHKFAQVKIKDSSGVEQLVYDINTGRNILYQELSDFQTENESFKKIHKHLLCIFDHISYCAVISYCNLKQEEEDVENRHVQSTHEDRLTLLGQMTSSFVHEFRNPLTTVQGFVQLLRAEHPDLPYMDIISSELEQLKFRITQFLMLSKKQEIDQEEVVFSLNDLIDQVSTFVYPRLLELKVSLQQDMQKNLFVKGIQEEIRQVIINIIFNAIEVMANTNEESVIHIKGYQKNNLVYLEASNTGPKIPDSLIKNIFEPFVTTKKTGTGLGLYVSRQIIEKHHGQLLCSSNEQWTTFTIILPIPEEKA
ncbi:ATP-binding protein [Siminovitchia sediminis]|uniref:histidine kinase n=1 Tax=Siminovitchia sediminis TaxID=1274353 RepID=A0ABW4KKJ0_9BACI